MQTYPVSTALEAPSGCLCKCTAVVSGNSDRQWLPLATDYLEEEEEELKKPSTALSCKVA